MFCLSQDFLDKRQLMKNPRASDLRESGVYSKRVSHCYHWKNICIRGNVHFVQLESFVVSFFAGQDKMVEADLIDYVGALLIDSN